VLGGGYVCLDRGYLSDELVSGSRGFSGPVEHDPNGSLLIDGGDQVSIAAMDVALKRDTDYLLKAKIRGSAEVRIDLYGDSGRYDSEDQELVIPRGQKPNECVYQFNSGDAPDVAMIRIFFKDPDLVWVDSISLRQSVDLAKPVRRLLAVAVFAVCGLFAYPYRRTLAVQALGLFGVVTLAYFMVKAPETQNVGDNILYVPSAQSLLREGNFDVDEYSGWFQADPETYFGKVRSAFEHKYNFLPVGTSIVILPLVFLGDILFPNDALSLSKNLAIAAASAKLLAALSVALMFLVAWELTGRNRLASVVMALLFGFATSHFSAHAGGLWSHNVTVLAFLAGLYLIVARNGQFSSLSAVPLAVGYIARPDFGIVVVVMSLYVFLELRRAFLAYAALGLSVLAWFITWSYSAYAQWLPPYYLTQRLGSPTFWEALAGNLISPNRGLFVYTPIALFSVYGGYLAFKERRTTPSLLRYIFVVTGLHWIAISCFPHWWAGYSYGPRFFCTILPALILLLVPVLRKYPSLQSTRQRLALVTVFGVLAAVSTFIQIRGATAEDVQLWNALPVSVDSDPQRIWDWRDWQPVRGLLSRR